VTTSFTVTFVRDRDFPHKAELDQIEQRFHNLTPAYFKRLNKIHIFFKDIPEDQWPEWQAVLACSNDAWEVRRRPVQQSPTRQVSAPKPKPTPKQPVKKAPPAPVVKLKSPEEYVKDFCKAQNWDKNKKGKDEFLKGLLCYFTDFKDINALKYFQKAVEINPKEPIYWQWLADPVYYQKDYQYNYQKSIEIYHQALKELPNNQYILENLIYTYIRAEEINNAEEYLKILKKVTPDDDIKYQISALRLKGGIQEAKGEFKEAMQLYNEADKLFGSEKNILVGIYQRNLKDKMKKSK
jgi:tetratricopeptide (TPR) repeat protein